MSPIVKVALAGATGNLGPAILDQLLKAGFEVTVLTRIGSNHTFPASVKVASVDYDSLDSLAAALAGQDAFVSTLGAAALDKQVLLIDAAIKAGVKRFIPSEYGSDTANPKSAQLPVFGSKVEAHKVLREKAAAGQLTYTLIANGPFFDWAIRIGWLVDLKGKSITLWDGGERPFGTTTLATVGQAVAGVLKHPEETKNRFVYVQEAVLSLKQLQAAAQKVTGADGWTVKTAKTADELAEGYAELKKPQPDPNVFAMKFINVACFAEGYGSPFPKTDNELLGIKELTGADIEALLKSLL